MISKKILINTIQRTLEDLWAAAFTLFTAASFLIFGIVFFTIPVIIIRLINTYLFGINDFLAFAICLVSGLIGLWTGVVFSFNLQAERDIDAYYKKYPR